MTWFGYEPFEKCDIIKMENREHVDLEEPFRMSADVEFSFTDIQFETLLPLEEEAVKKKQESKVNITNVDLRNTKSKGSLF
jgi:hypothetical protein